MSREVGFRGQREFAEIIDCSYRIRIDARQTLPVKSAPPNVSEQLTYLRKLPLFQLLRAETLQIDPDILRDLTVDRTSFHAHSSMISSSISSAELIKFGHLSKKIPLSIAFSRSPSRERS